MGSRQWLNFSDWPPPATPTRWYLHAGRELAGTPSSTAGATRYRFDPADPTPIVGGNALNPDDAGPKDNRSVESRSDVVTFTSKPMAQDVVVIGPVRAVLFVRSSVNFTDFFVRLCDVFANGRSINLCEGIVRVSPENFARRADGSFQARVDLTPTANTFQKGHRIRVQVSSGAHPLHSRNPGTGEPLATATRMICADQEILYGPDHHSAIELSVVS
jgi:uncharacterized protein